MGRRAAIVLAAGKSTRIKSDLPKVLHEVCGQPMLAYVLDACTAVGLERLLVVVGVGKEAVIEAFGDRSDITWVEQREQKGSGHAVQVCEPELADFDGQTLVIAGDMPLIRSETVEALLDENSKAGDALTLATSILDDPSGYGRIVRDDEGRLVGIVEHADCSPDQLAIDEVNVSYYCFDTKRMLEALGKLTPRNVQGEYYITDTLELLRRDGHPVGAIAAVDPEDAMGINSRVDLAVVTGTMQGRIQNDWMESGVTIVDPQSTWIDARCRIGPDTVIHPFSHIGLRAKIGAGCRIGPFARVDAGEEIESGRSVGPVTKVGVTGL